MFGRNAQPDGFVYEQEQEQRSHNGDAPGKADAGGLVEQLAPVPVNGSGGKGDAGGVFAEGGVDGAGGKRPVSSAPRVPPAPWTPKASRESS